MHGWGHSVSQARFSLNSNFDKRHIKLHIMGISFSYGFYLYKMVSAKASLSSEL